MRRTLFAILLGQLCTLALAQPNSSAASNRPATKWDTYRHRFESTQVNLTATGASSCSSTACHGGATPLPGERFLGDEWDRWWSQGRGPHFQAFKRLTEDPRSDRMAKLLYGANAVAINRQECRTCHTLDVPQKFQGRAFESKGEGVSCEACHGRSEQWMGPHQNQSRWRTDTSVDRRTAMGFYDTLDLARRAELCLSCHLGTHEKKVTHGMLAAGHPPLNFELASHTHGIPKHWNDKNSHLSPDEGSWYYARVWATGQAVTFRELIYQLAQWARRGDKTDYAVFECFACHHSLNGQSWRQHQNFLRPPGEPMWDASTWAMVRPLVNRMMPAKSQRFINQVEQLIASVSMRGADQENVLVMADDLVSLANELIQKTSTITFDRDRTRSLLQSISRDGRIISLLGYRAAVQAYLGVEALYLDAWASSGQRSSNHDAIYETIKQMHGTLYSEDHLELPDRYDPFAFDALLKTFGEQIAKR